MYKNTTADKHHKSIKSNTTERATSVCLISYSLWYYKFGVIWLTFFFCGQQQTVSERRRGAGGKATAEDPQTENAAVQRQANTEQALLCCTI